MAAPRLKTNLAILVAGDALGKLVNVFVFGRLGRILEKERYGQLEFAMAVAFVGTVIIQSGLGLWGARAIAIGGESQSRILGRVLVLRSMILAVILVVLGALSGALGASQGWPRAALLLSAGLMLVPKVGLCDWLFQGRNEMASVTLTALIEPLVALAGTVLLVHEPEHLGRVPFILAASIAATVVAQLVLAWRRGVRPDVAHGLDSAGRLLREALPLGLSIIAWSARFFAPMIAIELYAPGPGAGAFGAAHRLTVSIHAVVWLWFFNLLPTWSAVSREAGLLEVLVRRSLKATVFLAALLVATVVFVAPGLVRLLYGPGYDESVLLLHPLIFVPALAWVSGNWRFGLIARGALHDELVSSLAGAVLCVGGLLVASSRLDPRLAATIFCVAEAVTLVVAWMMWRRRTVAVPASR